MKLEEEEEEEEEEETLIYQNHDTERMIKDDIETPTPAHRRPSDETDDALTPTPAPHPPGETDIKMTAALTNAGPRPTRINIRRTSAGGLGRRDLVFE